MTDRRVCVIANPAAGGGRGRRVLPAVVAAFARVGVSEVRLTSAAGDEATLARQAIGEGFDTLVAVGGDGTWSNVAGAIVGTGADCRLALVAAGTGNDFAASVGAPARDVTETARLAVGESDVRVDVGRIEDRFFLNIAGFGFDVHVVERVNRHARKRAAAYVRAAVTALWSYEGIDLAWQAHEESSGHGRHLMVIVANARRFGGGFPIAPSASMHDGLLDVTAIRDATPLQRARLFMAVARGKHAGHRSVRTARAPAVRLSFAAPPAYEVDGERHQAMSDTIEVSCIPRALRVVVDAARAAVRA